MDSAEIIRERSPQEPELAGHYLGAVLTTDLEPRLTRTGAAREGHRLGRARRSSTSPVSRTIRSGKVIPAACGRRNLSLGLTERSNRGRTGLNPFQYRFHNAVCIAHKKRMRPSSSIMLVLAKSRPSS